MAASRTCLHAGPARHGAGSADAVIPCGRVTGPTPLPPGIPCCADRHHADPACPRHGRRVALDADAAAAGVRPERGWHPDATWRLIQLLAALGLIYKVKQPRVTVHFAGKQLVPSQSLRQTHLKCTWHIKEPEEVQELLAA
jgi:hypothetical protein